MTTETIKRLGLAGATLLLGLLLGACGPTSSTPAAAQATGTAQSIELKPGEQGVAVFAGGCFWCTESDFDKVPGVLSTTSGYIGGTVKNPTYEQVSSGKTGHLEAVLVSYDPNKTSYAKLLEAYWPTIDPLTANAQFCDHGSQYRSAIFYSDDAEEAAAQASKTALQNSGRLKGKIVTEILPGTTFYPAEEYHQDYYLKNPLRYKYYRTACGRDSRLEDIWGSKG
ncbi:peptide-methionine (S)-S-oxide reductase MsrA [Pseudomonas segetis]|uniref:Peptide methionine sulfoxide reductase MsrA n=1 Tax=Pseudomonas segetis TaxID=298908 RepID=A0A239BXC1_9PSED|nr:peptide-methionine (S)-S-oxide reductase MsrA [Pseudomonas segetis]SNS12705.1 peptide-methionine (S)-S-oxide reductase [Pseudomonas segetis]